jgi:signal transduction histidine kinase
LDGLLQMRAHALRVALGFAVPTIVFVTILVHITVRRMVGRPLRTILGTMQDARAGNLASRTAMNRHDELGTIANGLNEMLDQLERSSQSLQNQVEEATRELMAARESLGRAERVAALGQVAANVAHQAGTPLNLVSGYIQMIRDDPGTDERIRLKMRTIDEQIQQVTRVLRSMLDHARHPPEPQVGSLATIIMRVRDVALPRLSRHNVRLKVSVAENLAPVQVDATQMEMALFNLVTNALDAMPTGGTLSIAATARPGGVRVEISDTGSGIPPAVIDRLFEPWVTTKPLGHGSGLGLAIVRDVVRAQGGTIAASNGTAGAVFVIDLPAADVERSTA